MTSRASSAEDGRAPGRELLSRRVHAMVLILLGGGILLVVGLSEAGLGWGWTGFGENDHLWDWMHLLVLPIVLLLLPFWVATHRRYRAWWIVGLSAVAVAFAVLLYGGYVLGWEWTGFSDNHLWDWLEMLVLPVSVALLPLWLTATRRLDARHAIIAAALLAGFAVLVVCGYAVPWTWTGFSDNTLWDWIQLFVVQFAIPVAVVVIGALSIEREQG